MRGAAARQQVWADGHQLEVEVLDEPCVASVDPERLDQIVVNLLDNAVKYSPDGGTIEVRLAREDHGLLLTVRDRGIGMPPEVQERIFEPFGRAPNAATRNIPGMGLGLYFCRRIAEQHGGRLRAESAGEGMGTTMRLWLPAPGRDAGEGIGGARWGVDSLLASAG